VPETPKIHNADLMLAFMTLIWGLHFIVIKDALAHFEPVTFNAIRFVVGASMLIPLAIRRRHQLKFERRDLIAIFLLAMAGSVLYQVLFVTSLHYTTSTNSALLIATMPTWTAIISMALGTVNLRRGLFIGLGVTFVGVALVILSRNQGGLTISENDLIGGIMALTAAFVLGTAWVISKPFINRYGGMNNAIIKHWFTSFGLVMLASPDLINLRPSTFPVEVIPNILFSGILASVGGYTVTNYAIGKIGPTRTSTYHNITPLVAALGGILILHEPLTLILVIGGTLTLTGVAMVRRYAHIRRELVLPFLARPVAQAEASGD